MVCVECKYVVIPFPTTECQCLSEQNLVSFPLAFQCMLCFCILVADLISPPVMKAKDLAFQWLIRNQSTVTTKTLCLCCSKAQQWISISLWQK